MVTKKTRSTAPVRKRAAPRKAKAPVSHKPKTAAPARKKKKASKWGALMNWLLPGVLATVLPGLVVVGLFVTAFLQMEKDIAMTENEAGQVAVAQAATEPVREIASVTSRVQAPLSAEFKEAQKLSLEQRIEFWSAQLESRAEVRDQLEFLLKGMAVDDLVPMVPKTFDCTTYVETVLALARSEGPGSFFSQLVSIRYKDGKPGFFSRNHFPDGDWIPNNRQVKILDDITFDLARSKSLRPRIATKTEHPEKWLNSVFAGKQVPEGLLAKMQESWKVPREVQLPYISISDLEKISGALPSGSVVNLVHREDSKHPVLIAHQGFIIQKDDQTLLRHASTNGQIRTVDLKQYLKSRDSQYVSWPLIGINLNQVQSSGSSSETKRFKASM